MPKTVGLRPCRNAFPLSRCTPMSHVASTPLLARLSLAYSVLVLVRVYAIFVQAVFFTFHGSTCSQLAVGILAILNAGQPLIDFFC